MPVTKRVPIFVALFATTSGTTCQGLCDSLETCAKDPTARGSYCKTWNTPHTCSGLFYKDDSLSTMCFQPNEASCPESHPVECPSISDATVVAAALPVEPKKEPTTCQEICDSIESCREDPQAHGSYCKFVDTNPICFGMFLRWT